MSDIRAKNTMLNVLSRPPIDSVRVSYGGVLIDQHSFSRVRQLVRSNHIDVFHNPNSSMIAEYNSDDYFTLKYTTLDTIPRRAILVHEAVHAACDVMHPAQMLVSFSEAIAYIAQCLYGQLASNGNVINSKDPDDPTRQNVFDAANAIAADIRLHGAQPNPQQFGRLMTAIRSHPLYRRSHGESAEYNGVSTGLW